MLADACVPFARLLQVSNHGATEMAMDRTLRSEVSWVAPIEGTTETDCCKGYAYTRHPERNPASRYGIKE